jgi:hypothetical protein
MQISCACRGIAGPWAVFSQGTGVQKVQCYVQFACRRSKAPCVVTARSHRALHASMPVCCPAWRVLHRDPCPADERQPHIHHQRIAAFRQHVPQISQRRFGTAVSLHRRVMGSVIDSCVSFERFSLCQFTVGLLPGSAARRVELITVTVLTLNAHLPGPCFNQRAVDREVLIGEQWPLRRLQYSGEDLRRLRPATSGRDSL